jgi:hypothetical protein
MRRSLAVSTVAMMSLLGLLGALTRPGHSQDKIIIQGTGGIDLITVQCRPATTRDGVRRPDGYYRVGTGPYVNLPPGPDRWIEVYARGGNDIVGINDGVGNDTYIVDMGEGLDHFGIYDSYGDDYYWADGGSHPRASGDFLSFADNVTTDSDTVDQYNFEYFTGRLP